MITIKIKFIVILMVTFLVSGFLFINSSQASTSILRGSAWWANQSSYLYFNCQDDLIGGRLDIPYNLCGNVLINANPLVCNSTEPLFRFYSAPCSTLVHQVDVASNGNFSGKAWNYAQGLVDFFGTTPPNYNFNTNCSQPLTCTATNNCTACYNENTQQVYGWAQVEKTGEWLNLHPATSSPVQIKSWNLASSTNPYYTSLNPGDFLGYATTTSSNLSFNCLNTSSNGAACTSYKVYISNLQIGHLSAPNWSTSDACSASALEARLEWKLKSGGSFFNSSWPGIDYQIAFRVIINTANSTSSPVFDSGIVPGSATQYIVNKSKFPNFNYNTSYYWWIQLEDQKGDWTPWYQFGGTTEHNGLSDTIFPAGMGTTQSNPNAKTFQTYRHEFPTPVFTWSPTKILVSQPIDFTSIPNSKYYTDSSPALAQGCSGTNCYYLWTTDSTEALISSSTNATTSINFGSATGTKVTLKLTDTNSYSCSTSTTLQVKYGLPLWREVKP